MRRGWISVNFLYWQVIYYQQDKKRSSKMIKQAILFYPSTDLNVAMGLNYSKFRVKTVDFQKHRKKRKQTSRIHSDIFQHCIRVRNSGWCLHGAKLSRRIRRTLSVDIPNQSAVCKCVLGSRHSTGALRYRKKLRGNGGNSAQNDSRSNARIDRRCTQYGRMGEYF